MLSCLSGEGADVRQEVLGSEDVRGTDDHFPVLKCGRHFISATNLREGHTCK